VGSLSKARIKTVKKKAPHALKRERNQKISSEPWAAVKVLTGDNSINYNRALGAGVFKVEKKSNFGYRTWGKKGERKASIPATNGPT